MRRYSSVRFAAPFLSLPLLFACGEEGSLSRPDSQTNDSGSGSGSDSPGGMQSTEAWQPEAPPADSPVATHGALRVEGTSLVNESGEPVQLKGVSSMWLNWEVNGYAENKSALEWMRDNWGLSVMRAAMGVEPNGAYLTNPSQAMRQVRRVVRNAIEAGVYVIIDWHDHAAELHQAEAIDFFEQMAEEFGEYPNVFYETYNEPENDGGMKPWDTMLKPYHEAVVGAIRAIDPDNIAILGTGQWSQRVDIAAQNMLEGENLMYTVHFYSCTHQNQQISQANAAYNMGAPIFVTEWGATHADGGTDRSIGTCETEAQMWHEFMDARMISWAAWKLDDCGDLSCFFRPGAPFDGGWTDDMLNGHANYVIQQMQR